MILYFRYIGQRKSTEQKIPAEHILPPPQKRDNSRIVSKKMYFGFEFKQQRVTEIIKFDSFQNNKHRTKTKIL